MFAVLAWGTLAGAFGWPWVQVPLGPAVAGCVVLGVLGASVRSAWVGRVALGAAGVALGWALVARVPAGPELRGEVVLRGVVARSGEGRRADVELVAAGPLGGEAVPQGGRVRVIFPARPPPPGAPVRVAGFARRIDPTHLPGTLDPVLDAARAGIRSEVRASEVLRFDAAAPPPATAEARHAGLLRALVDGDADDVPDADAALLRRSGTWHLVSISGLHVGVGAAVGYGCGWIVARPLARWARRWGWRWLPTAGGILGAVGYTELADWGVPAQRALCMAVVGLVAMAGSRRPDAGATLGAAALAVVVADPAAVGSLGFQLSFLAMLGLVRVTPRLMRWVPPDLPRPLRWAAAALASSVAATVGTLPVVALHIQVLSLATPLANLWAVPWIGTVATPLAVLAAALDGAPRRLVLAFADAAIDLGLGGLALLDVEPWAPAVSVLGAIGLGLVLAAWRRARWAVPLTMAILAWPRAAPRELVVTFLAVGQGDATLVEWPDGRTWLVDGGPPGQGLLRWLRARGVRQLDAVFLSHLHPDHYGGLLPVLDALPVEVYVARERLEGQGPGRVKRWATAHPALLPAPPGFGTDEENDRSGVLRIRFGAHTLLLPGDAEAPLEGALLAADARALRADVLKVGHHGSRTSSTAAWIAAVQPRLAVIPAGFDNRYRHPHGEVVARLQARGIELLRTDRDGSVEVRTDGQRLRVRTIAGPTRHRLR